MLFTCSPVSKLLIVVCPAAVLAKNQSTAFYGNASALAESQKKDGLIYVGTDDGLLQITEDAGKNWRKVLAGANRSTGCGQMSMSTQEPDTVYATTWDFRRQPWTFRSGGPGSGIFKSTDGGERWSEIADNNSKGLPAKPYGRIAIAVESYT